MRKKWKLFIKSVVLIIISMGIGAVHTNAKEEIPVSVQIINQSDSQITVGVYVGEKSGIAAADFYLSYNSEKLEYVKGDKNKKLGGLTSYYWDEKKFSVNLSYANVDNILTEKTEMYQATFHIKNGAVGEAKFAVTLGAFVDDDVKNVQYSIENKNIVLKENKNPPSDGNNNTANPSKDTDKNTTTNDNKGEVDIWEAAEKLKNKQLYIGRSSYVFEEKYRENKNYKIVYSCENTKIAAINQEGKITPKRKGTTKVKVSITQFNQTKSYTINLTVKEPYIKIISAPSKIVSGKLGEVKAKWVGKSGKITYYSSNKKIFTVGKTTGKIKGLKKGKATITCQSGKTNKKLQITVVEKKK